MLANRRLFDLVKRNAQRRAAEDFLQKVPDSARVLFDEATRVFHPEVSDLAAKSISRANELQRDLPPMETATRVHYTSSRSKALEACSDVLSRMPNGRFLLVVGGGNGVCFDDESLWVSTLPGNYVSLPNATAQIEVLLQTTVNELVLVCAESESALVLETSSGYLPEEPSADEVIYELSAWGLGV